MVVPLISFSKNTAIPRCHDDHLGRRGGEEDGMNRCVCGHSREMHKPRCAGSVPHPWRAACPCRNYVEKEGT